MGFIKKMGLVIGLCLTLSPLAQAGQAEDVLARIKQLLSKGKELEACRAAEQMKPFKELPVYAEAEKIMAAKNLDIEDPLYSWTAKQMIRAQNIPENELINLGNLKTIGLLPDFKDAWGTPVRIEMVQKPGYIYIVRSAGPDKVFMTGDDPIIGGRDLSGTVKEEKQKRDRDGLNTQATDATRQGIMGGSGKKTDPSPGAQGGGQGGGAKGQEQTVDLDDLLKTTQ